MNNLAILNLDKKYGKKMVLSKVSISVKSGEICGILGVNGAGKSTLMKLIAGIISPDNGEIIYNGQLKTNNNDFGFMIESPCFYDGLSVKNNLFAFSKLMDNIQPEDINNVISMVGLLDAVNKPFKSLSTGMKQRLYFAYAMLSKPKVLVLDEPFSGIDPLAINDFEKILLDYANNGGIVLISSHDLYEINYFCTSAYILDKGKIIYETKDLKNINLKEKFVSLYQHN